MKKKLITFFVSFLILNSLSIASAQQESATIVLEPKYPEPRSTVTLTLESYSFNVNTAMISWKIGSKVVLEGQGEKKLNVKTGDVGSKSSVVVTATLANGSSIEQTINLTPSSVVLLYEAPQSYVPLLYEGRSLPADGALVRVTALPSVSDGGRVLSPSSLSYTWYVNGKILPASSGVGKQVASINLDYLSTKTDIKVLIHTPLGNSAEKTVTIYPHVIMPLLYTYDNVLGPNFWSAVDKRYETTEDFTLALEPFYISDLPQNPATYTWYLNGFLSTPLGGRVLAFHPTENSYGTKMLSIKLVGSDKRIQKAETQAELIFDTRK